MADIVVNAEVKSNIGEVSKEAKDAAGEFQIMGVSLNGVKKGFASAGKTAKMMFGSIKAGLISTGIGAFVIIIGSLVTYFTNTKEGAEKLEKALSSMGAAISVITDRISGFGKIVSNIFSKPLSESLADVKENFKGITAEIKEEVKATLIMVDASQKLRDAQRALNVETAQSIADVEKLKLVAEDITKTYAEREAAAVQAFGIEKSLENKRIALAEETLRLKQQEVDMSESSAEDLDALAEAEIALANVKQEAAGRQISLQNFLNGLRQTEIAEKEAQAQKDIDDDDAAWEKKMSDNDAWNEEQQLIYEKELEADKAQAEKKKEIEQGLADFKKDLQAQAISALGANLDASMDELQGSYSKEKRLAEANGQSTEAIDKKFEAKRVALANKQKAFKVAEALITTYQMASLAYKAGLDIPGPAGLVLGPVAAAVAAAAGLANVRSIMAQDVGGGGGGGGGGASAPSTPAPQMMSGAFDISGGVAPEASKAYVVTDEMSNSQNQLANIRRRATI